MEENQREEISKQDFLEIISRDLDSRSEDLEELFEVFISEEDGHKKYSMGSQFFERFEAYLKNLEMKNRGEVAPEESTIFYMRTDKEMIGLREKNGINFEMKKEDEKQDYIR